MQTSYNDVVLLYSIVMGPNIEKGKDGDLEKSQIKVGDISAVADAGKDLSSALVGDGLDIEKQDTEKKYLWTFLDGRLYGKARRRFLEEFGLQETDELSLDDFKEKFETFKGRNSITGIIH